MGYDAIAVGPQDLSAGIDFLTSRSPIGFPWISANILDNKGAPLFLPYVIKKIGNNRIGVIGLTGEMAPKGNMHIVTWEESLPPIITELTQKTDMLFLLSTLTSEENEEIATKFPKIRIIITGDPQQRNQVPRHVNNALLTQTTRQGKYLGILSLQLGNSGKWGGNDHELLKNLQSEEESLTLRIAQIHQNKKIPIESKTRKVETLEKRKASLRQKRIALQDKLDKQKLANEIDSSYSFKFIAMSPDKPEDKEINTIITNLKKINRHPNENNHLANILHNMSGNNTCIECHESQSDFWAKTKHADAFSTLLSKGQAYNLDCLPCHVTYNDKDLQKENRNLQRLLSLPSDFLGVGCESCHGPSRAHRDAPEKNKPITSSKEEICLKCHTVDHDDNFQYSEKIMKVQCPSN